MLDAFDDLMGLARVFPHVNLAIDLLAVDVAAYYGARRRAAAPEGVGLDVAQNAVSSGLRAGILDAGFAEKSKVRMQQIVENSRILVLASHSPEMLRQYCNRAVLLKEGQIVKRGQVLGKVGHTGDASPDGPHLHFAVNQMAPGERWWNGTAINPYPLLAGK